jgi:serine/threonine-protein kinase
MAPEVITHGIRSATVAADVWGLGAILYELLAGHRPFEAESIPELVRSVASDEPAPLRTVPADLAAIAFRALHKDPGRRYLTVQAMADDLRAWLAGQPVAARPYPWWERLEFATKRHPWIASGIAVSSLLAVAAVFIGVRESRLRRQEQAARLAATQEAATSREILKFVQNDLLAQASPESQPDREIKLRTVLDRTAKTIDGRFPDQPLVEAAIRETLAWTYFALGDETKTASQAAKSIALYTREKGPEAPEILRMRHFEAYNDVMKGKLTEAENLSTHVLAIQRRTLPASNTDTYDTWKDLIQIYEVEGNAARSEVVAHEAIEVATSNLGPDHPQTIKLEYTLARALSGQRRRDCLPVYRRVLEKSRRVLGEDNSFTLLVLAGLSTALGSLGDDNEALSLTRELLAARTRVLGPRHVDTISTMLNLAAELDSHGKLQEADPLFAQGQKMLIEQFGREDQRSVASAPNLVSHYFKLGKFREGLELGKQALPVFEHVVGPENPNTLRLKLTLCTGYVGLGDFESVIALAEPLVERRKRTHAPPSDQTMADELVLANAHRDLGHYDTAEALYHEVDSMAGAARGDASGIALLAQRFEAQFDIRRGRFEAAEASLHRALAGFEPRYGPTGDITLSCKMDLARLLLRRNATAEAEKMIREVVAFRERDAGIDALPTFAALDTLGVALGLQGHWAEAETALRRSGEHWRTFEPDGWREAMNHITLGWVLYTTGRRADAVPLLEAGYATVKDPAKFSPSERVIRSILAAQIAEVYQTAGDIEASNRWRELDQAR